LRKNIIFFIFLFALIITLSSSFSPLIPIGIRICSVILFFIILFILIALYSKTSNVININEIIDSPFINKNKLYELIETIIVADNIPNLALVEMAIMDNNKELINNMMDKKYIYYLPSNVMLKIIDTEGLCYIVKVIGGEYHGVIGYVQIHVFETFTRLNNAS
jgi:hypothetical protein